jgi:polar amino acid transport system substrate-binding protein
MNNSNKIVRLLMLCCHVFCQFGFVEAMAAPLQPITLYYYERKPFHYTADDGSVTGLTVVPTEAAFAKLGIPIRWEKVPANRILAQIKLNSEAVCSPGWYKKPDREEYARYTVPIYLDKPLVGLANAHFKAKQGITAHDLLSAPGTRLLVKQNFSQGAYMDKLIAQMAPSQIASTTEEVSTMVKMIYSDRADLIVTTQEEVKLYIYQAGLNLRDFRVLVFPDVPAVEKRYILCSRQVSPELIENLDRVLPKSMR